MGEKEQGNVNTSSLVIIIVKQKNEKNSSSKIRLLLQNFCGYLFLRIARITTFCGYTFAKICARKDLYQ